MDVKSIDTQYKGYLFRSRLEARWAVFFDELGLHWEYEKEGYDLGKAGWYLPDFWLDDVKMFAEVKPKKFSPEEYKKAAFLMRGTGFPVLMLIGTPENRPYTTIDEWFEGEYWGKDDDDVERVMERDWSLTMIHIDENRFYYDPTYSTLFDDTEKAVIAARSARF